MKAVSQKRLARAKKSGMFQNELIISGGANYPKSIKLLCFTQIKSIRNIDD
jgi:hypothetical protein